MNIFYIIGVVVVVIIVAGYLGNASLRSRRLARPLVVPLNGLRSFLRDALVVCLGAVCSALAGMLELSRRRA
jgi:hypothetical protein